MDNFFSTFFLSHLNAYNAHALFLCVSMNPTSKKVELLKMICYFATFLLNFTARAQLEFFKQNFIVGMVLGALEKYY